MREKKKPEPQNCGRNPLPKTQVLFSLLPPGAWLRIILGSYGSPSQERVCRHPDADEDGKGGDVSEMPKMGLEKAAIGGRKSKEVDVHDGLNTSEVSSGEASFQLVYLLACFAISKRKQLKKKISIGSQAVPICHLPSSAKHCLCRRYLPPPVRKPSRLYFISLERGQTVAI